MTAELHIDVLFVSYVLGILGILIVYIFEKLNQPIFSESGGWIILGGIIGGIARLSFGEAALILEEKVGFHADVFANVFLPIIIFEAGWGITQNNEKAILLHNIGSIIVLAFLGTVISMAVTFFCVYGLAVTNLTILGTKDILVLSALISSTDPVATLSVFSKLRAHPLLHSFAFGESILNDAVSIIIFKTCLKLYEVSSLNGLDGLKVLALVPAVAIGSFAIGVAMALVGSLIMKFAKELHGDSQIILLSLLAMLSYRLAELATLSGVVSIFFFGICARHYLYYSLKEETKQHVTSLFTATKSFCEMLIFVLLGVQMFFFHIQYYDWALIGVTVASCVLGRIIHIFLLTTSLNFKRSVVNQITVPMKVVLVWAGLRGAVAYSLALSLPSGFDFKDASDYLNSSIVIHTSVINCSCDDSFISNATMEIAQRAFDVRHYILTTTLSVILFTIFVFGTTTAPLLKFTKLAGDDVEKVETPEGKVEDVADIYRAKPLENVFKRVDHTYLIPFFSTIEGRSSSVSAIELNDAAIGGIDLGIEGEEVQLEDDGDAELDATKSVKLEEPHIASVTRVDGQSVGLETGDDDFVVEEI